MMDGVGVDSEEPAESRVAMDMGVGGARMVPGGAAVASN